MTRDELGTRLRAYRDEAFVASAERRAAVLLELERLEWVVQEVARLTSGDGAMARTPAEQEAKRSTTNHDYLRRVSDLHYRADTGTAKATCLELALRWDVAADAGAPVPVAEEVA